MADDLPAIADIAIAAYSGYIAAMGRKHAPMRALLILVVTGSAYRQATISLPPRPRLQVTLLI